MNVDTKPVQSQIRVPHVRQFSILLVNKVGALFNLVRTLREEGIHICGISVIDTADSSMVRVVVDDPDACRDVLNRFRFPFTESPLVVVELPIGVDGLDSVLQPLIQAEVNLQYTYSLLVRPKQKALLALHCEEPDYARDALTRAGFVIMGQKDISR